MSGRPKQNSNRAEAIVFVSGSRSMASVPEYLATRLDSCRWAGHRILMGDADGVNAFVQSRLALDRYRSVLVYHSGRQPRHNEGGWQTIPVVPPAGAAGFAFHAAKDRAMASEETHALAFWDGRSPGTLLNVLRMASMGKPAVVGLVQEARFLVVHDAAGVQALLSLAPRSVRAAAESRAIPTELAFLHFAPAGSHPEPSRNRIVRRNGIER